MARSGSSKRKREKLLRARCSEEEFEMAMDRAEKAGLTLAALIRHLVLNEPRKKATKKPQPIRRDAAQLIAKLGETADALRYYSKSRDIPPDDPYLTAIWRDMAEMTVLCFEVLGRKL